VLQVRDNELLSVPPDIESLKHLEVPAALTPHHLLTSPWPPDVAAGAGLAVGP
jgi:hypothetical protein